MRPTGWLERARPRVAFAGPFGGRGLERRRARAGVGTFFAGFLVFWGLCFAVRATERSLRRGVGSHGRVVIYANIPGAQQQRVTKQKRRPVGRRFCR